MFAITVFPVMSILTDEIIFCTHEKVEEETIWTLKWATDSSLYPRLTCQTDRKKEPFGPTDVAKIKRWLYPPTKMSCQLSLPNGLRSVGIANNNSSPATRSPFLSKLEFYPETRSRRKNNAYTIEWIIIQWVFYLKVSLLGRKRETNEHSPKEKQTRSKRWWCSS